MLSAGVGVAFLSVRLLTACQNTYGDAEVAGDFADTTYRFRLAVALKLDFLVFQFFLDLLVRCQFVNC